MRDSYNYCVECGRKLNMYEFTVCIGCNEEWLDSEFNDEDWNDDDDFEDGDDPLIFYKE